MQRTQLVKRVLGDCYCSLQPSRIHGIGVFAVRDIPNRKNPFRTLKKYASIGYVRITEDELDALPQQLSALIRALFIPTDGAMHVPNYGLNVIHLKRLPQPLGDPQSTHHRRIHFHRSKENTGRRGTDRGLSYVWRR